MQSEVHEYSGVELAIDYGAQPESLLVLTMHHSGGQNHLSMTSAQARQLLDLLAAYVRAIESYKNR